MMQHLAAGALEMTAFVVIALLTICAGDDAGPPSPPAFVPLPPRPGVYPVPPVPTDFQYLPPDGGPLPFASAHPL